MGKVIHKEINGEVQKIIEFESYEDFKDWWNIGCSDTMSLNSPKDRADNSVKNWGTIIDGDYKLDINWDDIDPEYNWAAMDLDGNVCVFDDEPSIDNVWNIWDNNSCHLSIKLSNPPPKEFWKETLTKRTDGKQKMEDFYKSNYKLEGYQPVEGKPSNPPKDE